MQRRPQAAEEAGIKKGFWLECIINDRKQMLTTKKIAICKLQ